MRKRLITPTPLDVPPRDEGWLDLDGAAVVEVTSENKDYPVFEEEHAIGDVMYALHALRSALKYRPYAKNAFQDLAA